MAEWGITGQDGFFWENESWGISNSDNSAGSEDQNLGQKNNSSTCSTRREAEEAGAGPPVGKRKRQNEKQQPSGNNKDGGGGKGGELEHELHIWTERERRKKMRRMFSNLQALLPQLPPKADKSTIVDEAVSYIRTLPQTLQRLQKQKLEILQGLTTTTTTTNNYESSSSLMNPPAHRLAAMDSREAFLADQGYSTQQMTAMISPIVPPRYPTSFRTWAAPNMILSVCGDRAQINICCPKKLGLFTAICYFLEKHKLQVLSTHVSCDQFRSMYMIQAHASGSVDQYSEGLSIDDIFQLATYGRDHDVHVVVVVMQFHDNLEKF